MSDLMTLEDGNQRLAIGILDYEESAAMDYAGRNALLTSLEVQHGCKSSIVTAPLLSTYELAALATWFEQMAGGQAVAPVVLQEPCLFFNCQSESSGAFLVTVRMEAEASPTWTKYYAEPFTMCFRLTPGQMLETARALQRIHQAYPTQP